MNIYFWMAFCLLVIISTSCTLFEKKSPVLAQVNSEKLTEAELKAHFSEVQWNSLSQNEKREYVQQWITLTLLAQEADKLNLDKDISVRYKYRYALKKIKSNALIATYLAATEISEEDLFKYYRVHQGEFTKQAINYQVQRIFHRDYAMIEGIKNELTGGMKFDDAARLYSQEPLGQKGGYMGLVTSSDADSIFWMTVKNLKQNELTVVSKDNGWYILRWFRQEEGSATTGFDEVKDEVRRRMLDERRQQVYDDLIKDLKSKSDVYLMI